MRTTLRLDPLDPRLTPAVTIRVDYSFDSTGFFNDPTRRAAVERAAAEVSSRLDDSLAAIVPGGGNTWRATFENTITGRTVSLSNPIIRQDEIVAYAAGGSIGAAELGITSGGAWSAVGDDDWLARVRGRGKPGAASARPTAVAPWGGFTAFDSETRWDFTPGPPAANQWDFDSVARHEFLHLVGFGIEDAFDRWTPTGRFTGPNAVAAFGGPVPLDAESGHWAAGVTSAGQTAIMVPTVPAGEVRGITPLDWAALADMGWNLGDGSQVVTPPSDNPRAGAVRFAVGVGAGPADTLTAFDGSGRAAYTLAPFDGTTTGGVRVAAADVTADGTLDIVAATGPGTTARVRVFDGETRQLLLDLAPFESFTGGVYVAAGDIDADGRADLVITPDEGGGPRVDVYSGAAGFPRLASFFGIDDANFRGGARAAVGDLNADGAADVVVAAGFGGGPRVAGFDGRTLTTTRQRVFGDFFAFEPGLRNGVFVAAGDIDGDGNADLAVGGGPGGGPRVTVFGGSELTANRQTPIGNFFGGDADSRGGVRVAVTDLGGDGRADVLAGAGDDSGSRVSAYSGRVVNRTPPAAAFAVDVYPGFFNGVYVG